MNGYEHILKPSEAARRIGVATATIHIWRKRGIIIAVTLPNRRYGIPIREVERLTGRR
jgi:predicted site-specific integrase-resolvase